MHRAPVFWLLPLSILDACAASGPGQAREGAPAECAMTLAERGSVTPAKVTGPTRAAVPSQIVVHVEAPLEPMRQALESRIQQRLAEGRVSIGLGGQVTYSVERGALLLSVTRTALVVEAPVRARAEACRGSNCYAACEPEARVRAEVPLMLSGDYRFAPTVVSLRFTKGCKVRALGGFLTVDVTPTIEHELAPELAKLSKIIDQQLPDLRGEVEKAWSELSAPRTVPMIGCVVVQPIAIVQGPLSPSTEVLHARFALVATPELRRECGALPTAKPLPPLRADLSLPQEGVVQLGLVTALSGIEHAFEAAAPTPASGKRARAARAQVAAHGSDVKVDLVLGGDVCGSLALLARPDFSGDGQFIGLKDPQLVDAERERLAQAELQPAAFSESLAALPQIVPLLSVSGFRQSAPTLAAALSQPRVAVAAQVSSARAAGAAARADELVAWLEARGSITLTQR